MYRCDVGDAEAVTGNRLWAVRELTWYDEGVRYPGVDFLEVQQYVVSMVSRYCGMEIELINRASANIVSRFEFLDGRDGVLANAELPAIRPGSGDHVQLTIRFDTGERPTLKRTKLVAGHEMAHILGVIHNNRVLSLMNSGIGAEHGRFLDEWDDWTIDELRSRYGPATNKPVPLPDGCTWIDQLCAGLWQVPR